LHQFRGGGLVTLALALAWLALAGLTAYYARKDNWGRSPEEED
jgi:hypothetical protein